jgi:hypothetical protein
LFQSETELPPLERSSTYPSPVSVEGSDCSLISVMAICRLSGLTAKAISLDAPSVICVAVAVVPAGESASTVVLPLR